jgi:hypothetical protein
MIKWSLYVECVYLLSCLDLVVPLFLSRLLQLLGLQLTKLRTVDSPLLMKLLFSYLQNVGFTTSHPWAVINSTTLTSVFCLHCYLTPLLSFSLVLVWISAVLPWYKTSINKNYRETPFTYLSFMETTLSGVSSFNSCYMYKKEIIVPV